ncbi:MAG: VWA domain-containing protein [Planctomycetes bacterium]|nr:VWA domain-containing protein [Planctomycetota bacterium]
MAATQVGFVLLAPGWLVAGVVASGLTAAAWWGRRRQRGAVPFAGAAFVLGDAGLAASCRQRLSLLPALLTLLAWWSWSLALARPVFVTTAPPTPPGRDVLLCLDRSSSMLATDLARGRTRLDVGKQLAAEFAAGRPHDRIGCVEFARHADLRCPPTLDHTTLGELLQAVQPVAKDGPEDATAIGGAVAFAAALLRRSSAAGRVVVLMTDGDENVAVAGLPREIAPAAAAQLCRSLGVRVHTIVLGRQQTRADGSAAALDTRAVRELAADTGGRFFTAGDAAALRSVYAAIDALEGAEFAVAEVRRAEWYAAPAGLGLLLLLLAGLLRRSALAVLP